MPYQNNCLRWSQWSEVASSLASTVQTSNALLVYLAGIIDRDPKWRACSHYSFSICETGNALLDYLIGIIGVSTKSSELQHYHYFIYYFPCTINSIFHFKVHVCLKMQKMKNQIDCTSRSVRGFPKGKSLFAYSQFPNSGFQNLLWNPKSEIKKSRESMEKHEKARAGVGNTKKYGKAWKSMEKHGNHGMSLWFLIKILNIGASASLDGIVAGVLQKLKKLKK